MENFSLPKKITIILVCVFGLILAMPNAFYTRVEQSNDARAVLDGESFGDASVANLAPKVLQERADAWPSFLPSSLVNLGLDLRGGAHLLAEVDTRAVYKSRMDNYWPELRNALAEQRDTFGGIRRLDAPDDQLHILIAKIEGIDDALRIVRGIATPVQSLTDIGSTDIEAETRGDVIVVTLSDSEKSATDRRTMEQSLEIIRRRVDEAGTREPTIQRQGENRILIQVPGIGSAEALKDLIGKTAKLEFYDVVSRAASSNARLQARQILLPAQEGGWYILERTPIITGDHLRNATSQFDEYGRPAVGFTLNVTGARIFGEYTANNIGSPFAIVLDGEVLSAPTIQSYIPGGSGIITGSFSLQQTKELSIQLRAGALPAPISYEEERTIGPELGQDSIDAGKLACIVAFAAVLVFMALSYGLFGLFANLALLINVAMIFGLLSAVGATLTLPGIAGIVLTIGMAVDANVLVFERIREELKTAKNPYRAVSLGYERAFSAIIDANITTFIAALILFVIGSGPVRGFAITLGLGILTSVFTAIWVTRMFALIWLERRRPQTMEL